MSIDAGLFRVEDFFDQSLDGQGLWVWPGRTARMKCVRLTVGIIERSVSRSSGGSWIGRVKPGAKLVQLPPDLLAPVPGRMEA
jgi:hypothetical protein